MKLKIRRRHWEIAVILILGLVPLLWFTDNKIILGHDAGLTLSPVSHFLDRLYSWTVRFGFGTDQSYALPGFFIHGFEALIYFAVGSVQTTQKIVFIFWFVSPGLAMYFFASKLEQKLQLRFIALPAALFYMFNHFLLQGWFIAERAKFSLYVAAPIMLLLLFEWKDKKIRSGIAAATISLLFFVFNGLASLPLFGGIFLLIFVFILTFLIGDFSFNSIKRLVKLFVMTVLFSLLLNAYWLLPYGRYVLNSYTKSVEFFGGVEGILDWINYVSGNSSYFNLIRLQGIPEWYQNPLHPYAKYFLSNPILILISFLIPLAVYGSLLVYKGKKVRRYLLFFVLTALVSIIFAAGSHPPFGFVYLLLVKYVPGFIAFRTPFYKFSSSLWLSYAVLLSFFIGYFVAKFRKRKFYQIVAYIICCAAILLYSFPFFTGSFFDYIQGVRSMRVAVPQYIYDFGKWSEQSSRVDKRTLMLPPPNLDSKIEAYKWGYWSLAPLTTLLTNANIINDNLYMTQDEQLLLAKLYKLLKINDPSWVRLAELLNIQSLVVRNDFDWNLAGSPTDKPSDYKEALKNSNVIRVKKFGEWDVYDINSRSNGFSSASKGLTYIQGSVKDIPIVLTLPVYNKNGPIFVADQNIDLTSAQKISKEFYLSAQCVMCDMQWKFINTLAYTPTLTRSSMFYPFIESRNKNAELRDKKNSNEYLQYLVYTSLTNVLSMQKIIDQKIKLPPLYTTKSDYLSSLGKISSVLNTSRNKLTNDSLLELVDVLRADEVILTQIDDQLPEKNPGADLNKILNMTSEMKRLSSNLKSVAESFVWRTTDKNEKKLLINAPESGVYKMFYRSNKVADDSDKIHYQVNGNDIVMPIYKNKEWYELGTVTLKNGDNRVMIHQTPSIVFQDGSINLAGSVKNCFTSNTITSDRGDIFSLTFKHTSTSKNAKFFVAFIDKSNRLDEKTQIDSLTNSGNIRDYQNTYASNTANGFRFVICNSENVKSKSYSSISLTNILLEKLEVPDVVFYKQTGLSGYIPDTVIKNNQVKFEIKAENPRVMTFDQSFNNNWVLNSGNTHFIADGYANGWIIKENKTQFSLIYTLQNLFIIGSLISLLSVAAMVYLILRIKR